ncbi:homeobox protein cut-like 1 [Babylonia areolata]|uniref:homeobox protein cut-like 1 n=1 Tax=Babylonia areolata TaxID=304850 RepID=UPI003FD6B3C9
MAASVQSMCNFWKNFNLQELQRELDVTAGSVASRQDDSEASRKRLVQLTRDFKKNTPEDVRQLVSPLVKSFQGEVDSLSKRSKAAEGAFLALYKRLVDAPDPAGALEQAVQFQKRAQRVSDLEIANKQLRETLEDYNHEFAEVKNQEVTIKQLRDKLRDYEATLDTKVEARGQEKERELQQVFAERERHLQDTQLSLAKNLEEAQHKIVALEAELEKVQSELFDVKSKYDEATSAKSDEMDMVMADLERATEKAAASEREAEQLRQQLQTVKSSSSSSSSSFSTGETSNLMRPTTGEGEGGELGVAIQPPPSPSLHLELAAKEKEVARLMKDVQELQSSFRKLQEDTSAQVSRLEEELKMKNKTLALLEDKLCSQDDYQEIKRELGVLKSMEFSRCTGAGEVEGSGMEGRSLEVLLLEKNKALESDNTQLKVTCADLTGPASVDGARPHPSFSSPSSSPTRTPTTTTTTAGTEEGHDLPSSAATATATAAATAAGLAATQLGMLDPRNYQLFQHPGGPLGLYLGGPYHPAFLPHPLGSMVKREPGGAAADALDTLAVASKVRELLAAHGIGQRVFARAVLELSQGTVSELLSKPKAWDKLTEKGRESFRKMDAWTRDWSAIKGLKDLSPKKNVATPTANSKKEDLDTEERINSILLKAKEDMKAARQDSGPLPTTAGYLMEINSSRPTHSGGRRGSGGEQPASGESVTDFVSRIYQRVLENRGSEVKAYCKQGAVEPQRKGDEFYRDSGAVVSRQGHQREVSSGQQQSHKGGSSSYHTPSPHHHHQLHLNGFSVKPEPADSTSNDSALELSYSAGPASGTMVESYSAGPIDLSKPHRSSSTPTPSSSSSPVEGTLAGGEEEETLQMTMTTTTSTSPAGWQNMNRQMVVGRVAVVGEEDSPHYHNNHHPSSSSSSTTTPGRTPSPTTTGVGGVVSASSSTTVPVPADALSPIQRMHSIANSVSSRTGMGGVGVGVGVVGGGGGGGPVGVGGKGGGHHPHLQQCRGSAPPSPIPPEQLERYSVIQTEELVVRVKEKLSEHSISQRVFGERVLGLSQGSVSDLLARPKPWHLLTQKGKEPFIRMQMFLDDAGAVPKLLSTSSSTSSSSSSSLFRSHPHDKTAPRGHSRSAPPPSEAAEGGGGGVRCLPPHPSPPPPPPPPWVAESFSSSSPASPGSGALLEAMALTSEVDTVALTGRVKAVLQAQGVGQKVFGEAVLGLSQGSVSELLSRPKPWPLLSAKGREPFVRMHQWLSRPWNVEWLRAYHSHLKGQKRRKGSTEGGGGGGGSVVGGSVIAGGFDSPVPPPKRPRIFFTEEQKETLRGAYRQDPYPSQSTIDRLATQLGLGVKTVVNWFHNHRMRAKQQHHYPGAGGGGGNNNNSNNSSSRSETADDNSNHSDLSSVSGGDFGCQQAAAVAAAAVRQGDSSPWMFPRMEPLGQQLHSNGKTPDWDPDSVDETDVNRRKRSNPQRVYEGMQLDRTKVCRKVKKGGGNPYIDMDPCVVVEPCSCGSLSCESMREPPGH